MQVLLVEDEPSVASMLNKGLGEEGYQVTVAPDGRLGLQLATDNPYSIIILDVMLPGINGLELCRLLRSRNILTPILMLTALATTDNVVTGLDAGADDYITKPFKFKELSARLRSLARTGRPGDEPDGENRYTLWPIDIVNGNGVSAARIPDEKQRKGSFAAGCAGACVGY
jgi:DNA-binding response OmpR family regulator